MSDKPTLEDPPTTASTRNRSAWAESRLLCDQNPGRWVKVPGVYTTGTFSYCRRGGNGLRSGVYESTSTTVGAPKGRLYIYIRRVVDARADA